MKYFLRTGALVVIAALFALPANAQDPAPAAGASECDKAKTDVYPKWHDNRKAADAAAQKVAYDAGKEFLAKCTDAEDAYVKAVKKWITAYEGELKKIDVRTRFVKAAEEANRSKNYAPVFAVGKELHALEPENLELKIALSNAGELNATAGATADKSLDADAVNFTRLALAAVEAGKGTPNEFKQLSASNKEEAAAMLKYRLGMLLRTSAPEEASNNLLAAAQSNTPVKNEPALYYYLAQAYGVGDYKKLADDFNTRFAGKDETPESALAQAKLNQAFDRVLDAYARAVAFNTKTDPNSVKFKNDTLAKLTELYKQRHDGKTDGLNELVSGSSSRRLPLPTDPVPTPPAAQTPAPSATATPTPTPTPTPAQPPRR
jgi:hypothetical protein